MTDETNVAEAANDTATPAVEAQPEANDAPVTPETPADPDAAMEATLDEVFDKMNAPEEEPAAEVKAEDATDEGETKPSPEGDAEETDQPKDEEGEQANEPAIVAPASWSKEMGEHWATMASQLQEYVAQREQDSSRKISEQGNELARARPFVEVAQQYQQNFDRHGVTFEQGMTSLMNAQMMLEQNPLQGLAAIAQTFGIDLAKAFGPEAQQLDPATKQLLESNRILQAQVQSSQRDQHARTLAEDRAAEDQANNAIAEWLGKEGRPYFDQVEASMTALIQTQQAADLDSAYDMACHANPTIRAELLAAEKAAEQAKADEAARLKAQQDSAAKARAAKEAGLKARINGGNRASVATVSDADFLSDEGLESTWQQVHAS